MRMPFTNYFLGRTSRVLFLSALGAILLLASASPSAAQKKKKKDNAPPADSGNLVIPMSDEQQIDYLISEMLGAWQLGDIEKLHKDYADDVSIVSGAYAPPVIGWANYLASYQLQKARMSEIRYDRSNTYVKVRGTVAWACYQWDFAAVVAGQASESRGQTTLILEKRNDRWIIVHNHTSLLETVTAPQPGTPPATQPQAVKPPSP